MRAEQRGRCGFRGRPWKRTGLKFWNINGFLSERLGRDAGNRVAAIDYAENIAQISGHQVERRTFGESWRAVVQRAAGAVDIFVDSRGMQALSGTQRAMRGVPRSAELDGKNTPATAALDLRALYIPAQRIAEHSLEIQEHKWFLSERLGRDVGARVAAVDYLENVQSGDASKSRLGARLAQVLEGMMEASGPNSIANLERALRTQNSASR